MQLYIIRHAQSQNNASWLETGSSKYRDPDPQLTEIGMQQKEYLANFLKGLNRETDPLGRDPHNLTGFGFTHIYCSLMVRAVETGKAVADALGLPLVGWRDIHETGGIVAGDGETEPYVGLPGKTRAFFEAHYPELKLEDEFGDEGWWNKPFEEDGDRHERAKRVVRTLEEKHGNTEDRVAIVTHGAFYNYLMRELIGIDGRQIWFALSNAAVTRWDFHKDRWGDGKMLRIIDYTNRVDFLPQHLITP